MGAEPLQDTLDIVGTGGDSSNTFNISTCCAFVAAAAGVPVAKHGNRSVSSNCGSADVLEALGTNINLTPKQAEQCINQVGLCFMFAPLYHKSMKHAITPRKELGLRTIFNILGPLSNPAFANYMLLGVFDEKLVEPMAKALLGLGLKGAMVVHSLDNLDEISISAPTTICEVKNGEIINYTIEPSKFGIKNASLSDIQGGDALQNAEIIINILSGKKGAKRDIVLLNSAAALYISGKVKSISDGINLATHVIDSGAAFEKFQDYKNITQNFTEEDTK